jgi:Raf kinase inhibitor-like YbhB/YbcL family protein
MEISSPAFENGGSIPREYTRDGDNKSPPLRISDVPKNAQSLVLILDDPDSRRGTFTHWLVFNLDPQLSLIDEARMPKHARQGANGYDEIRYSGPTHTVFEHRYVFKLVALSSRLDLANGASRLEVEKAMRGRVIATALLTGKYVAEKVEAVDYAASHSGS